MSAYHATMCPHSSLENICRFVMTVEQVDMHPRHGMIQVHPNVLFCHVNSLLQSVALCKTFRAAQSYALLDEPLNRNGARPTSPLCECDNCSPTVSCLPVSLIGIG